jgi:cytochrome b561
MATENTAESWGSVSRTFHWIFFILVAALLIVGNIMIDLPKEDPARPQIYNLHKSFGVVALVVALLALAWRLRSGRPDFPSHMKPWEIGLARTVHALLYATLLLQPVSGYIMSAAAGFPPSFFGLFMVPDLVGKNEPLAHFFNEVHYWTGWAIVGLLVLHLAGAAKHHFIDKDNTLRRMMIGDARP